MDSPCPSNEDCSNEWPFSTINHDKVTTALSNLTLKVFPCYPDPPNFS